MLTFIWPGLTVNTSGLATAANQVTGNTSLASIDDKVSTAAKQDTGNTSLSSIDTKFTTLNAKDFATQTTLAALNTKVTAVNTGAVVISSSALPTGAATEATLASIDGKITAVNTGAVIISSSALPSGAATEATLSSLNGKVTAVNTGAVTISSALPTGTNNIGDVDVLTLPSLPTGSNVIGAVTQSGTWTVQPGNTANTTAWLVTEDKSATATLANVASSASSVTLQASNTARKGWMIHNDSSAVLYVKFGTTASTSSYTVKLIADAYYEMPQGHIYTGIIDGIWASATGAARVTEY